VTCRAIWSVTGADTPLRQLFKNIYFFTFFFFCGTEPMNSSSGKNPLQTPNLAAFLVLFSQFCPVQSFNSASPLVPPLVKGGKSVYDTFPDGLAVFSEMLPIFSPSVPPPFKIPHSKGPLRQLKDEVLEA